MKPRARRVTMGVAALVAVLVAVLAVANWGTVRDHVAAWHFRLTRGAHLRIDSVKEVVVKRFGGHHVRSITKQDDIARILDWCETLNLDNSDEKFGDTLRTAFIAPSGWVEFVPAKGNTKTLTLWWRHVTWDGRHYANEEGYYKGLKALLAERLGPP